MQRILVTAGPAAGQFQGRQQLLLDVSAGESKMEWPLYRSVTTVTSLADDETCTGCLRQAIQLAEAALKPGLIQFAPDLVGTIVLSGALPELNAGDVTIDALDIDGRPHARVIDGNGFNVAALKITGSDNTVLGLDLRNVGGNSDTLLVEGPQAHRNLLDSLRVTGRAIQLCGDGGVGCVVDGNCLTPTPDRPLGMCGDDGIAIRGDAGTEGENVVRRCEVTGAFDKGIKVSNGAAALVEESHVHGNADGGLQATLSGQLSAIENLVENNAGNSANGLAANGPDNFSPLAARLDTRGNISRCNSLRGISVRSRSDATLRDDYVCGNGTPGRGSGFGLGVFDAAGLSAFAEARGLAIVNNLDAGVVIGNLSQADLGRADSPGNNTLAFNGDENPPADTNLRNLSPRPVSAIGDQWEHCGHGWRCDEAAITARDVFVDAAGGDVDSSSPRTARQRQAPRITEVTPSFAVQGDLVRLYGTGFDAIDGNGPGADCDTIATLNTCRPVHGNCVLIDRQPADVVAVTPTMLVVKAPFTCVSPVTLAVKTRTSIGFGRASFCILPVDPATP